MQEILDAMTWRSEDGAQPYLDLQEGAVVLAGGDFDFGGESPEADAIDAQPERYAEIPLLESRAEYDLMCRFAERVEEHDLRDKLDLALQGKGAFGRFRDVLRRYPDLEAQWRAVHRNELVGRATSWLGELGIEPVFELPPLQVTQPAKPVTTNRPDLIDVLLLGAPEGKTELVDGRVRRVFLANAPAAARQVFKHLARQICEFYGVGWRNRFVEGVDTFELERMHISVTGELVELRVDVSMETWQAFG